MAAQPPTRRDPPTPDDAQAGLGAASLAALVAAGTAVGPAALGATGKGALVGAASLPAATAGAIAEAVERALDGFWMQQLAIARREARERIAAARPDWTDAMVDAAAREELAYEDAFRRKSRARWARELPRVMAIPDAAERRRAVEAFLARERRYSEQRYRAIVRRVAARVERERVRDASPLGAYWTMDPRLRTHTPGCVALAGHFWPWSVIDRVHPPLHANCGCRLWSLDEAVRRGWMRADQVPDEADAVRRARELARRIEELHGELSEAELQEASRYALRYPKGTVRGGEFRPRRRYDAGGLLRKHVRRDLRRLLEPPPHAALRDDRETVRVGGRSVSVPWATMWRGTVGGERYFSPPQSTSVYRDRVPVPRAASPAILEDVRQRANELVTGRRAEALKVMRGRIATGEAPVRKGEPVDRLGLLPLLGFRRTATSLTSADGRPAVVDSYRAEDGRLVRVTRGNAADGYTDVLGSEVTKSGLVARALDRPPRSFEEFKADAAAWAERTAARHGRALGLTDIGEDRTIEDSSAYREWDGQLNFGPDVRRAVEDAAAARKRKGGLTDEQAGEMYVAEQVAMHEASHAVNVEYEYDFQRPGRRNLEEALTEEASRTLVAGHLEETGQEDVLRWMAAHPGHGYLEGNYRSLRRALASALDRAGVAPEDREAYVTRLKFEVDPNERIQALARDAAASRGTDERSELALITSMLADPGRAPISAPWYPLATLPAEAAALRGDGPSLRLADGTLAVGGRIYRPGLDPATVTALFDNGDGTWDAQLSGDYDTGFLRGVREGDDLGPGYALAGRQEVRGIPEGAGVAWARPDGKETRGTVDRVLYSEPGGGWAFEGVAEDGRRAVVTSTSTRGLRPLDAAERSPEGSVPRREPPASEHPAASEMSPGEPWVPDTPTSFAPPSGYPGPFQPTDDMWADVLAMRPPTSDPDAAAAWRDGALGALTAEGYKVPPDLTGRAAEEYRAGHRAALARIGAQDADEEFSPGRPVAVSLGQAQRWLNEPPPGAPHKEAPITGSSWTRPWEQTAEEFAADPATWWHGTQWDTMGGGDPGLIHLGDWYTAFEALRARTRYPGLSFIPKKRRVETPREVWREKRTGAVGDFFGPGGSPAPGYEDRYERVDNPLYREPFEAHPRMVPVRIVGPMADGVRVDTVGDPHPGRMPAESLMRGQLHRGVRPRRGYFYRNEGEGGYEAPDPGHTDPNGGTAYKPVYPVSAVVPSGDWLRSHEDLVRDALARGEDVPDRVLAEYPHLRREQSPGRPGRPSVIDWFPGSYAKGWVEADGRVVIWTTDMTEYGGMGVPEHGSTDDEGRPVERDYAGRSERVAEKVASGAEAISIWPDGTVFSPYADDGVPTERAARAVRAVLGSEVRPARRDREASPGRPGGPRTAPDESRGARLYHGAHTAFRGFEAGQATYLAPDPEQARVFAERFGLLPSPNAKVIPVDAPPGRAKDVSAAVDAAIARGDDPQDALDAEIATARGEGYRYVTYDHPSGVEGEPDFTATVSLHPNEDLGVPLSAYEESPGRPAKSSVTWFPGQPGKGWVWPDDGRVLVWQTTRTGDPEHGRVGDDGQALPPAPGQAGSDATVDVVQSRLDSGAYPVTIDEDGTVHDPWVADPADAPLPEVMRALRAALGSEVRARQGRSREASPGRPETTATEDDLFRANNAERLPPDQDAALHRYADSPGSLTDAERASLLALVDSHPLPGSIRATRKARRGELDGLRPGDEFAEHRFASASVGVSWGIGVGDDNGELRFTIPAGTPAYYNPSSYGTESEVILPPGARFRVTGERRLGERVILDAELLGVDRADPLRARLERAERDLWRARHGRGDEEAAGAAARQAAAAMGERSPGRPDPDPDSPLGRRFVESLQGEFGPGLRARVTDVEAGAYGTIAEGEVVDPARSDAPVGTFRRRLTRENGRLVVSKDQLWLDPRYRHRGFAAEQDAESMRRWRELGVDRVEVQTDEDGGYVWARLGYRLDAERELAESGTTEGELLENTPGFETAPGTPDEVRRAYLYQVLEGAFHDEERTAELDEREQRPGPTPARLREVLDMVVRGELRDVGDVAALPDGRALLSDTHWSGYKSLAPAREESPVTPRRWLAWHGTSADAAAAIGAGGFRAGADGEVWTTQNRGEAGGYGMEVVPVEVTAINPYIARMDRLPGENLSWTAARDAGYDAYVIEDAPGGATIISFDPSRVRRREESPGRPDLGDRPDVAGRVVDAARRGGATIDPATGTEPSEGFAVALEGHSSITPDAEFFSGPPGRERGRAILRAWLREHRAALTEGTHIGVWHDVAHREVVLDPVDVFPSDAREEAIAAGRERDQQAIYDLGAGEEIPTEGTGGREATSEP